VLSGLMREDIMFDFANQVVLITGASGNLGGAIARSFEQTQAHLALVDRSEDRLRQEFPELADSPDHYLANCADMTQETDVRAAIGGVIERFGRIDVLINAIGGYRAGQPVHETPLETWDFMLNLNARSLFVISQAVAPHMLAQKHGKIVNVSARAALSGGAKMAAYSISKSAVVRLTESMAAELKDDGINVNCILPGTIDTPQNREATPDADFERWVKPEAMADVILFLASDLAQAITGAAVPVYGRS
ncbi:MAG TPA: SDR family NAD(P)-dependent oxidoreductase, partial [Anaerolineae bacterium]